MSNYSEESTSSLYNLSREVLKKYNIYPIDISIVQSGAIKTVWKIKTKDKELCLKRLRQSYEKALFSVNAQIYVKASGGIVPGVFLSNNNEAIVQHNNELFVLYEWLDGRALNFSNNSDLCLAIKGLASFHKASKGYTPDDSSRISTKLNRWPAQYESMMKKLLLWKEQAISSSTSPNYTAYLKAVDAILKIGAEAQRLIAASPYTTLTTDSNTQVLCHQDYGTGNALLGKNGVIVLDLDGVTKDLASRDLRKLIFKYQEPNGKWQPNTQTSIIDWYCSVNPLSEEEKQVLYIDLLFPHRFYGLVKNLFLNNKPLKASDIDRISTFEQSKLPMLIELIKKR